jgi:hypothetical protein
VQAFHSVAAIATIFLLGGCSASTPVAGTDAGRGPVDAAYEVAATMVDSNPGAESGVEPGLESGAEAGAAVTARDHALNGIYVANIANVAVFALSAEGNVAPIRTVHGPTTKLRLATAVAVDSVGDLFVANEDMFGSASIETYPGLTSGDVAPLRALAAPGSFSTNRVVALAVGPTDDLWVGEYNAFHFPANGTSSDYTIGSGPNLASITVSGTGEVALASSGGIVETYAAGDAGTTTPIRTLVTGKTIVSMAVASQTLFVLESTGSIDEFSVSANGTATPAGVIAPPTTTMQTAHAIAVDSTASPPILYVAADDATSGVIYAVPLLGSAPSYTAGSATSLQGGLTTLTSAVSLAVVHY